MTTMAQLSKGAAKLREQMNIRFPKRDTKSDGWIGDPAHAARKSDHNPDRNGIVHAIDLDADFGDPKKDLAQVLAEQLAAHAKGGSKSGKRVSYIIYNRQKWSAKSAWKPRKYTGSNPHTGHVHVSVTTASDSNGSAWPLPIFRKAK